MSAQKWHDPGPAFHALNDQVQYRYYVHYDPHPDYHDEWFLVIDRYIDQTGLWPQWVYVCMHMPSRYMSSKEVLDIPETNLERHALT
jgi:hypothetical protein